MEKITHKLALKLKQLLEGKQLPYGQIKSALVDRMLNENIVQQRLAGRSRKVVFVRDTEVVQNYLRNECGINDLQLYIDNFSEGTTRADNIRASSDSKSISRRTMKGFLVNCIEPIEAKVNGNVVTIHPQEGLYTYVHDFEAFEIPQNILVIGVENAENFRYLKEQRALFPKEQLLFVSRYPQSKDLIAWLKTIPNAYLHYGDFDFEGIRIYENEFRKHLGNRASFFIPDNVEELLALYGNKELYDRQYKNGVEMENVETNVSELIALLHLYKKCLEQEVLVKFDF